MAIRACVSAVLMASALFASQNALVKKKTNLRKDPSATHTPLEILLPDDKLAILDSTTSSTYIKVKADDGKVGWVPKNAVEILPDAGATKGKGSSNPVPTGGAISADWPKPAPVDVPYNGSEGACPGIGDGGDTATNLRKNRTDTLPAVNDLPWGAITALDPLKGYPTSRLKWTSAQLATIAPFEGVALRVSGYLTHKSEVEDTGSGESTNCHFHDAADVDWHIYLQENTTDTIANAVIVETTPRIRLQHQWDVTVLNKWVGSGKPIRVSGFLMVDPEHGDMVGKYRATVWEIHPITNIEVCNAATCGDSDWVALDQAQ